ncbi:hypothetical protein BH09ACT7_BH09ACT7_44000 [soil metagenome]
MVKAGLLATGDINIADVRVPVVAGFGLGAFAAGMAYPQVVAELPYQPGGALYTGTSPLAGSITTLPLVLLGNPGRANGGLFARFYPLAGLAGIDTVTPDNLLNIPVGETGITLGGANLIPVKIDGTVEYDPLSDFPAWPNPLSLLNSGAALLFPTYILRGVTAASLTEVVDDQLTPQLAEALANAATGPLALNFYLTVPVHDALPLLEPVRLPIDVINLFTGANLNNPIATALEPALSTLVNLGYTDVERTVVDGVPVYNRTLDQANVITPFGTLPSNIDWGQVPGDLLVQLGVGIQQAIDDGLVSDTPVINPLETIAHLIGLGNGGSTLTTTLNATAETVTADQAPKTQKSLAPNDTDVPATAATQDRDDLDEAAKKAAKRTEAAANRAAERTEAALKKAGGRVDKIAKDGQKEIQKVVKAVQGGVQKAVGADKKTETAADKAADKTTDKAGD